MTSMHTLVASVDEACQRALEEIGMTKHGRRFAHDINENVVGILGLNKALHRGDRLVEINPVVGVSHIPLQMMLAKIDNRPRRRRYNSELTVFRHLGYLSPQGRYTPWWFGDDQDFDATAHGLAATVVEHGYPFFNLHRSLEDFYESMVTGRFGGVAQYYAYLMPVAALMLGKPKLATSHLEEYVQKLEGRSDRGANDYRQFARRFLASMEGHELPKGQDLTEEHP